MNPATVSVAAGGAGRIPDTPTRGDRALSADQSDIVAPFNAQLLDLLIIPESSPLDAAGGAVAEQLHGLATAALVDPRSFEGAATSAARSALRTPHQTARTDQGRIGPQEPGQPLSARQGDAPTSSAATNSQPSDPAKPTSAEPARDSGAPTPDAPAKPTAQAAVASGSQPAFPLPPFAASSLSGLEQTAVVSSPGVASPAAGAPSAKGNQIQPPPAIVGASSGARAPSATPAKARAATAAHPMPKQPPVSQLASALAQAIKRGDGTVQLTLRPSSLGQVQVSLAIEGVSVTAKFEARAESAQQLLSQSIDQLRAQLAQRGLQLDGMEVVLRDSEDSFDGQHDQQLDRDHPTQTRSAGKGAQQKGVEPGEQPAEIDLTPLLAAAGRLDTIA